MPKKLNFRPAAAAAEGAAHRTEEHLGPRQVTLDEAIKIASRERRKPGRKAVFGPDEEVERLSVIIPKTHAVRIRAAAAAAGKTMSAFVAQWAETL